MRRDVRPTCFLVGDETVSPGDVELFGKPRGSDAS